MTATDDLKEPWPPIDQMKVLRYAGFGAQADEIERLRTEVERLQATKRVGCVTPDGEVMRGHLGLCADAGHEPIYRLIASTPPETET